MKMHALLAGAFGLLPAIAAVAHAGLIQTGDLIVVDRGNGTLDDVNPTTGASFVIASGFSNPQGVAISSPGTIFVSDIGTSTIDAVNPTNGQVTTFSGGGVGAGAALDRPFQMAFNASRTLFISDGQTPNGNSTDVIAIDSSGNRTVVATNNGSSNNLFSQSLAGLALDSIGRVYASAPTGGTIYAVSADTASPLLSIALSAPQGLAFSGDGKLLAVYGNPSNPQVMSINPANGDATVLSDNNGIGSGPAYGSLRGIAVAPDGDLFVTDVANNEIFEVNPASGDHPIISGNGVGGTTFGGLAIGIAVYPSVPEPSSTMLLSLGAAVIILSQRRRRSGSAQRA